MATAATVVLVQLIGATVDVFASYARLSAEMDVRGRLVVEQTSAAISQPLWDFDNALVEEVLKSLRNITDFERVAFRSIAGETEVELRAESLPSSQTMRLYSHPIIFEDGTASEVLGTLDVQISTSGLRAALWDVILHKAIVVLAALGLASTAFYVVLGRLSKPLEDLREAVGAIEREEFDQRVPSLDRNDEIGALANALNGLREREAELSMLRRASNEKVRREGQRILQALNSTRDAVVLVDDANKIVFINGPAKTYFSGLALGDMLTTRDIKDRTRADDIKSALLARSELDTDVTIKLHGAIRHFQARIGPIIDEYGNDLGGLFIASDITKQFETSKKASYLASHDPLTGLLNRRQMDAALTEWTKNTNRAIGVMLVDLDHFKSINDTFGHQRGDALLVFVAKMLADLSSPDDLVIRLGGDEFAIIAFGSNSEAHLEKIALLAVEKLQKPVFLNNRSVQVSISAGIAASGTAGGDVDALMRHADLSLYEAKKTGRGRLEVYKNELSARHERRKKMETGFQLALETDCIFPVFQMQTDIADGSVVGFETLARWNDAELGLISPAEFIPLAENADLIEPLTRRIMVHACETAVEWLGFGFQHRIAVNISPNLFDGSVVGLVQDCLNLTGCRPDMIELEITESVLMSSSSAVKNEIEDLRYMGFSIALDDFGVGYSSLDYLRRFPVDKIKIDRAFVHDIATSEQSRAIVTAIAKLGHSLGMKVTAEGAETQEDRLALRGCGVDVIQGFVDGRPAIKSEAEQIFKVSSPTRRAMR